jgi:serine/threonine-protein kinase
MNDQAMEAAESKREHSSEMLQVGDALGRYQLLCPIARGGMGQVWAARQSGRLGLPKLVAIKTAIPMESSSSRQVQEYLFDEAQVTASIDHPNVCKILELGQEGDVLFIAMEWLYGVPLSNLLSRLPQRRLDYRMAAYLVAQACSGLHAAHELTDDDGGHLDVVHRDATPHNLFITSAGELKVMDFGIVKSKNQQHQPTQTGELKGKISYLAPEQIRGHDVDRRADIFTLGCVLYVATVGKGAFNPNPGQDAGRTILKILDGDYSPPRSILPDYPPELEAIVARALATEPNQRFRSAEELRLALEGFLGDGSRSVSREDVAALLSQHCGQAIDQRRAELRSAQKLFDSQPGRAQSGTFPAAQASYEIATPLVPSGQLARSAPEPAADATLRSDSPVPSQSRRGVRLLVGATLFVAGLAAAAIILPRLRSQAGPSQPLAVGAGQGAHSQTKPTPAADTQRHDQPTAEMPVRATAAPSSESESTAGAARAATDVATRSLRKSPPRAAARAVSPTAPSAGTARAEPSPPNPNLPFSQTLSRKQARHAIDESDPFGK